MADRVIDVTSPNQLPLSERGKFAWKVQRFTWGSGHAALTHIIDTIELGALSLGIYIKNASGQTIAVILSVSQDGSNWTDIAHKDLAGSETVSGSFNIANSADKHLTVTYSDYPQVMANRYFKLSLDPAAAISTQDVFISLK